MLFQNHNKSESSANIKLFMKKKKKNLACNISNRLLCVFAFPN